MIVETAVALPRSNRKRQFEDTAEASDRQAKARKRVYFLNDSWISAEEIGDTFILDIALIKWHKTVDLFDSFTVSLHFVMHSRRSSLQRLPGGEINF